MWIRRKDYLRLREAEKQNRKFRDSLECANSYARYQDDQANWWRDGYYDLDKEKNAEILDLRKRILDLEYELQDVKEVACIMQDKLVKGGYYDIL